MRTFQLILFITALFFISCSKNENTCRVEEINGVKVYKNNSVPKDAAFSIEPKLIRTINGLNDDQPDSTRSFLRPMSMDIDKDGNIYILDQYSSSVKKYSNDGEFIRSFGRQGNGPGELMYPMSLDVQGDSVFVSCTAVSKFVKYDLDGGHVEDRTHTNRGFIKFSTLNDSAFIALSLNVYVEDDEYIIQYTLDKVDNSLRAEANFNKNSIPASKLNNESNFLDQLFPYAVSKNEVYIAENSEDKFCINVYDHNNKLLYKITRDYMRQPFLEKDREMYQEKLKSIAPDFEQFPLVASYKKAINGLWIDKDENLWVASSVKRNDRNAGIMVVDVFRDGVFINRVEFSEIEGYDFYDINKDLVFYKNQLCILDKSGSCVRIYEY